MPEPAEHTVANPFAEILIPKRFSSGNSVICDCCRQRRPASEFDADGCGICIGCLESDTLLVEVDASLKADRVRHPLQQIRPVITRGRT